MSGMFWIALALVSNLSMGLIIKLSSLSKNLIAIKKDGVAKSDISKGVN